MMRVFLFDWRVTSIGPIEGNSGGLFYAEFKELVQWLNEGLKTSGVVTLTRESARTIVDLNNVNNVFDRRLIKDGRGNGQYSNDSGLADVL